MKHNIQLILILFFPLVGLCQTGPGGVGKTDGTSDLNIWLNASDESSIVLSGSNVTQWSDNSGSGNHFTTISTTKPTYSSGSGKLVFSNSAMRLNNIAMPKRLFFVVVNRSGVAAQFIIFWS